MVSMAADLDKKVEFGDLTRAEADDRHVARSKRMELRYRELENRQRLDQGAEQPRKHHDLEALKKQIEQRLKVMSEELRKKVEAGEVSEIDAKATFDQAEATMWNRYRAGEIEQAETQKKSELDGIRKRIELRLQVMSEDLRSKVAKGEKGEISGTEAKATFDDAEKKMWTRYRAAEAKQTEPKKLTRAEFNAEVIEMMNRLKFGTITSKIFLIQVDEIKQNMVTDEIDSDVNIDARVEAMIRYLRIAAKKSRDDERFARLSEMVANREMTKEEMPLELVEFRQAVSGDTTDAKKIADYQSQYLRMFEMVKNKEMTMGEHAAATG